MLKERLVSQRPVLFFFQNPRLIALPETYIAPENGWLGDYFPIGKAYFQGLCQF